MTSHFVFPQSLARLIPHIRIELLIHGWTGKLVSRLVAQTGRQIKNIKIWQAERQEGKQIETSQVDWPTGRLVENRKLVIASKARKINR